MLLKDFEITLKPLSQLTLQEKSSYANWYRTEINPGGLLSEGKKYKILGVNDRSGGDWSFLVATDLNTFLWVPFEIVRYSDIVPEPQQVLVVKENAVGDGKKPAKKEPQAG
jgi:hypothetical protein